jgi:N,N'-diacetyllegionaminate synthase
MNKALIIAEAGVNYNGNLDLAKEMVHVARECGADIIKFQTAKAELVISRYAPKADYQKETTGVTESQLDMCRKILLPYEDFVELAELCRQVGIGFFSTPFELESIDFLYKLGMRIWKIPSGEITNLPYLEKIGGYGQKIILSTGMSTLMEVENAIKVLMSKGTRRENITLLHCTTEYPAPYSEVNLKAMLTLREHFGMKVGYSDHTPGVIIPIAAISLGASVIEKHFTLDKNMEGPDHKASLNPEELKEMIISIRKVETALGDGEKIPQPCEIKNIAVARKSIIAKHDIKEGELFTEENLTTKRPGNGISPMKWYEVLGTKAIRDFHQDELIEV